MDTETLTQVTKVVVVSALALALGAIVTKSVFKIYGALMDAIPPSTWAVLVCIVLVVAAFLLGAALL